MAWQSGGPSWRLPGPSGRWAGLCDYVDPYLGAENAKSDGWFETLGTIRSSGLVGAVHQKLLTLHRLDLDGRLVLVRFHQASLPSGAVGLSRFIVASSSSAGGPLTYPPLQVPPAKQPSTSALITYRRREPSCRLLPVEVDVEIDIGVLVSGT